MMVFVMFFLVAFSLTESRESEHSFSTEIFINNEVSLNMDVYISCLDEDIIMEEILDIEEEMTLKRMDQEDNSSHIGREVNLKNPIFTSINVITKEKQYVTNNKNLKGENHEIIYDDNKFRREIEESLAKAYIFDSPEQFEYDFIICNNKTIQEHLSNNHILLEDNQNEAKIPGIISSENQLENPSTYLEINSENGNKIRKNPHLPSTKISDNQTKVISARYINLDNSRLTTIPDLITYKECLESLSMRNNLIGYILENILELKSLRKLDLSHNMITGIHYQIKNMSLEWLDLSYNHITYLSCMPIFEMTTLKYLNLQDNLIEFIMKFNSEGLISLSMKNNFIAYIPESMAELTCLKILDLSYNIIDIIKRELQSMKLELLDLSYNYLTYLSCISIFSMTTLKYLNLQNNLIEFIMKFNSEGLLGLNISNNPVELIEECFYELPNIIELFMSNLQVTKSIYFNKTLTNLKVLDLSHNKSTLSIYNIGMLTALEEINLSNCELKTFPISSNLFNFKNLILCNNNIEYIPIDFKKLRANIKMLDLRGNPLKIILANPYIGALGLLEHFYGKVLLDDFIMQDIQKLSFDQIFSQKYKKDSVYFQKRQKNAIDDEFYINIKGFIVESDSNELKNKVLKVIKLVEEIRDSGFMDFGKIMKEITRILKCKNSKSIIIERIIIHLNTKFSSRFYRFLDGVLFNYKIKNLKSALNYIYNSDDHLNYWMYHLRDTLSFTGTEKIEVNSKIHNDKNIILGSFINIADPGKLIHIIKLELEKDKEVEKIFFNLLCNTRERIKKTCTNSTLKQMKIVQYNAIRYVLKKYQIIDQYQ